MFDWLAQNFVNIALILVILLVVTLLVRSLIRDKKQGKSFCGGNCASCGGCCSACQGGCRKAKPQNLKS